VPTAEELGYPALTAYNWFGLSGPPAFLARSPTGQRRSSRARHPETAERRATRRRAQSQAARYSAMVASEVTRWAECGIEPPGSRRLRFLKRIGFYSES
jgi:hypothetical protein